MRKFVTSNNKAELLVLLPIYAVSLTPWHTMTSWDRHSFHVPL